MNDPNFEKCAKCSYGELVRDNHDEYYHCSAQESPVSCGEVRTVKPEVKLIAYTPNPMAVIEKAASICYDSKPTKSFRIAKKCYQSGHTSVFEHASFTFEITGVSRALLAQITRHRLASYSVRSQRYCIEDGCKAIVPPSITKTDNAYVFRDAFAEASIFYNMLLKGGAEPEDARFVLPNACETKMVVTMNLRELISFCGLRLCIRAQWEIRDLARMMVNCVREVSPEAAEYLRPNCERYDPYCFCTEGDPCGRHLTLTEVFKKLNA